MIFLLSSLQSFAHILNNQSLYLLEFFHSPQIHFFAPLLGAHLLAHSPALSHQCGGSLSATILNPLLQYKSEPHGVEESSLPSVDNATESKTHKL